MVEWLSKQNMKIITKMKQTHNHNYMMNSDNIITRDERNAVKNEGGS